MKMASDVVTVTFKILFQDVFQSLLDLLGWAWSTLRTCVGEVSSTSISLELF